MKILAFRYFKYSFVGGFGIVIQLGCLAVFKEVLHLHYLVAATLAIEAAVLHNFFWHQRVTWKDRRHGTVRELVTRLARFHAGTALISIAGNLALMRWLVGSVHVHYLIANVAAIVLCSLGNFAVSEWFVFRARPNVPESELVGHALACPEPVSASRSTSGPVSS